MIDSDSQLYPFCIVWTIIPCISWLFPSIGHTGICNSQGVIHDFMGFCVHKGRMGFGNPIKYVVLQVENTEQYDQALSETNQQFADKAHNFCNNNCHHHVADVLNRINYQNRSDWTQTSIWWMCLTKSHYVGILGFLKVYLPIVIIISFLVFVYFTLHHK